MALERCRKCGKIASTAAKTCPHCKAKKPTRKPVGTKAKLVATAFTVAVFAGLVMFIYSADYRLRENRASSTPALANPTHYSSQSNEKHRLAMTTMIARSLKKSIGHSGVLEWERILADDNASVVCLEYRMKHEAGETNLQRISYVDGKVSEQPEEWNRHCTSYKLNDMTYTKDQI